MSEHRWVVGHLCLSLNDAPALGEISERAYSACCCNGLGIAKGALGSMAAADVASGAGGSIAETMLSQAKPQRLYPEPFMTIGARAKIRWMQRRAGRDI